MPRIWRLLSIAAAVGTLWAQTTPAGLSYLVSEADAIAVVEVTSADYTATAADGPMYAEAKIIRAVKGAFRAGGRIRFGASAWVGPSFQEGEQRIVLLKAASPQHAYYAKARWVSLEAGKIDLFIADEAVARCTAKALSEFLQKQATTPASRKVEFP